jgi:subtilisin family serine protease
MILALPTEAAPFVIPDANDRYWQKQWYLRQIQAPEAWRATTITKDVIVAVIDAGIDISHPDLREAIWTNPREIPENGIDDDQNGFIDDVYG